MQERFKDKAVFLFVYIKEAHPNRKENSTRKYHESVEQPKTIEARTKLAVRCKASTEMSWTYLVDDMNGSAQKAYGVHHLQGYVVDRQGKIAVAGNAKAMEKWLEQQFPDVPKPPKKSRSNRRERRKGRE